MYKAQIELSSSKKLVISAFDKEVCIDKIDAAIIEAKVKEDEGFRRYAAVVLLFLLTSWLVGTMEGTVIMALVITAFWMIAETISELSDEGAYCTRYWNARRVQRLWSEQKDSMKKPTARPEPA